MMSPNACPQKEIHLLRRLFCHCALAVLIVSIPQIAHGGTIYISSINGWTSPNNNVINGRWTGQPDTAPDHGKYYNCPNGQQGPCYFAADSDDASFWTIRGSGFGTKKGTVSIPSAIPVWVASVSEWTETKITVQVKSVYTYTVNPSMPLTITAADGTRHTVYLAVIATIRSRGYGQCTWFVAKTRKAQGMTVPMPSAYTNTGSITALYQPQRWDVINFTTAHTSIITSAVQSTTVTNSDGSKTVTYKFTIGEMNAYPAWNEAESSVASSFTIRIDKSGNKSIVKGILSNYSKTKAATAYYR